MTQAAIKRFTLAEYHRLIELGFLTTVSPIKILKEILVIASIRQIALRNETVTLPGFPDLSLDLNRVFPGSEKIGYQFTERSLQITSPSWGSFLFLANPP